MANPLVSVVIPAYNCEQFVKKSVHSALNQTMKDLEIIVIDDASTDSTFTTLSMLTAQDHRIRLMRNENNMGVANTRNRAIKVAKGQYIALLDGDDIWFPEKLEKQIAVMKRMGCDFCYTSYSFIDKDGQSIGKPYLVPSRISLKSMIGENMVGCSTVLYKIELSKKYHMRPEYAHEDYVFWLELLREGYQAIGISEPLMQYRVLKNSRSGNKLQAAQNRWKVYSNFLGLSAPQSLEALFRYAVTGMKKRI